MSESLYVPKSRYCEHIVVRIEYGSSYSELDCVECGLIVPCCKNEAGEWEVVTRSKGTYLQQVKITPKNPTCKRCRENIDGECRYCWERNRGRRLSSDVV